MKTVILKTNNKARMRLIQELAHELGIEIIEMDVRPDAVSRKAFLNRLSKAAMEGREIAAGKRTAKTLDELLSESVA